MTRVLRNGLLIFAALVCASGPLLAQRVRVGPPTPTFFYPPAYPLFSGSGGFGLSYYSGPYAYAPNYWWVSPYPLADPRQEAYNPSAGYEWDSVGTLILTTSPEKARVTLDGVYAGTADKLAPFQLPSGDHTLHVTADGYETYDTVIKVDKPGPLLLDVRLKRVSVSAKPTPAV